jgi:hypothetical protein
MSHSLLYSPQFFRDDAARSQGPLTSTRPSDLRSDAGLDKSARRSSPSTTASKARDLPYGVRPAPTAAPRPIDAVFLM